MLGQADQFRIRRAIDSLRVGEGFGKPTTATFGVIFGFDSDTSLESLADNVKEFNAQYDSFLWPDMVVVLDKGTISRCLSIPGRGDIASDLAPFDELSTVLSIDQAEVERWPTRLPVRSLIEWEAHIYEMVVARYRIQSDERHNPCPECKDGAD